MSRDAETTIARDGKQERRQRESKRQRGCVEKRDDKLANWDKVTNRDEAAKSMWRSETGGKAGRAVNWDVHEIGTRQQSKTSY